MTPGWQQAFRNALEDGDVARCRALWCALYPKMPQPESDGEAETVMHQARTGANSVSLEKRLYSHAWLDERGFPSQLPDEMKPPPQRRRPVIFPAVGVSVNSMAVHRREDAKALEKVMADAAGEMIACGIVDTARISRRMWEAREAFLKGRLKTWH